MVSMRQMAAAEAARRVLQKPRKVTYWEVAEAVLKAADSVEPSKPSPRTSDMENVAEAIMAGRV